MTVVKLSDRVRPGVEAAPWVCEEVRRIEVRLAEAEAIITELCGHEGAEGFSEDLNERLARFSAADNVPAGALWVPHFVSGKRPHWQCATPSGPYNFQALSLEEAETVCARERAAYGT